MMRVIALLVAFILCCANSSAATFATVFGITGGACISDGTIQALAAGPNGSTYVSVTPTKSCHGTDPEQPRTVTLLRLSADGLVLWERSFRGTMVDGSPGDYGTPIGKALATLSDGSVVVVGQSRNGLFSQHKTRGLVTRYSPEGVKLWEKHLTTPGGLSTIFTGVVVGPGDELIVAGAVDPFGAASTSAAIVAKLSSEGQVTAVRRYNVPQRFVRAVPSQLLRLADGGLFATFSTQNQFAGIYQNVLVKLDVELNITWQRELSSPNASAGVYAALEDPQGILLAYLTVTQSGTDAIALLQLTNAGLVSRRTAFERIRGGAWLRVTNEGYDLLSHDAFTDRPVVIHLGPALAAVGTTPAPKGAAREVRQVTTAHSVPSGDWIWGAAATANLGRKPVLLRFDQAGSLPFCATEPAYTAPNVDTDGASLITGALAAGSVELMDDPLPMAVLGPFFRRK